MQSKRKRGIDDKDEKSPGRSSRDGEADRTEMQTKDDDDDDETIGMEREAFTIA